MYGTCGRIDNKADFDFDFDLCWLLLLWKPWNIFKDYLMNPVDSFFPITFDQLNASLLNESISFF